MQAIATSLSATRGREHAVRHWEGARSSRLTQVQTETRTSANITLVTAEGDKVTLSTDTMMQAAYTRYDARGRLRGHGIERHAESFQLTSANAMSLQIEGDLNDAERADIQEALETIEQLATDFFSGKVDESPNQVFHLGDLNTLRSIDASLEFSQSLMVRQQTKARGVAAPTPVREQNTATLEAQPSATQTSKGLLDAILRAIETARGDVTQPQEPNGPSSFPLPPGEGQ
jgi:hypothetical protein